MKIAVIGAGISGISVARMLHEKNYQVTVFEKQSTVGGLIRCEVVEGYLYHKVGGHLFNSKNKVVLDWFWSHFDREKEFIQAKRNAKIWLDNQYIGYPIENHLYNLPSETVQQILNELIEIQKKGKETTDNFEDFLKSNFGPTLYEMYFGIYNKKIWNTDLKQIPLAWLEGKLPMPDFSQIVLSNILRKEEVNMVHSYFYYPVQNGSQFIIDRLSEGLSIKYGYHIDTIQHEGENWVINGTEAFDHIVYTGDIRHLSKVLPGEKSWQPILEEAEKFKSNGTTNILCECDAQDISWLYLPEKHLKAHRIIYTGRFSNLNNPPDSTRSSCVVEFSGFLEKEEAQNELTQLPGNLQFLAYHHEPSSYIVHNKDTASISDKIHTELQKKNLHLLGRFAEWQYYNMDKCMEAAMLLCDKIANQISIAEKLSSKSEIL